MNQTQISFIPFKETFSFFAMWLHIFVSLKPHRKKKIRKGLHKWIYWRLLQFIVSHNYFFFFLEICNIFFRGTDFRICLYFSWISPFRIYISEAYVVRHFINCSSLILTIGFVCFVGNFHTLRFFWHHHETSFGYGPLVFPLPKKMFWPKNQVKKSISIWLCGFEKENERGEGQTSW